MKSKHNEINKAIKELKNKIKRRIRIIPWNEEIASNLKHKIEEQNSKQREKVI